MTLAELKTFTTAKLGITDADALAQAGEFIKARWKMIWNAQPWRQSRWQAYATGGSGGSGGGGAGTATNGGTGGEASGYGSGGGGGGYNGSGGSGSGGVVIISYQYK